MCQQQRQTEKADDTPIERRRKISISLFIVIMLYIFFVISILQMYFLLYKDRLGFPFFFFFF